MVSAVVLSMLPWGGRFAADLAEKTPWSLGRRVAAPLRDAAAEVQRAKEAGVYTRLTILSVLVRVGKYGSMREILITGLAG